MANLLLPILTGIKVSFPASLDIQDILECMRETKITVLTGVPRLFLLFQEKIEELSLDKTTQEIFNRINALNKILKSS